MKEPVFLTLAEALDIHRLQIEEYGGTQGLRDLGLLESALAVPQASFGGELPQGSLFEIAAAYAYHIAEKQPFLDGNKRTALAAALVFLDLNGFTVDDSKGELHFGLIDIAPGGLLAHFPELHAAAAKCGADCAHDGELACALRTLPRYASYRAILRSLA